MERETDKHGPRIDDAMSEDLESLLRGAPEESRAREDRLQEDPDVQSVWKALGGEVEGTHTR